MCIVVLDSFGEVKKVMLLELQKSFPEWIEDLLLQCKKKVYSYYDKIITFFCCIDVYVNLNL